MKELVRKQSTEPSQEDISAAVRQSNEAQFFSPRRAALGLAILALASSGVALKARETPNNACGQPINLTDSGKSANAVTLPNGKRMWLRAWKQETAVHYQNPKFEAVVSLRDDVFGSGDLAQSTIDPAHLRSGIEVRYVVGATVVRIDIVGDQVSPYCTDLRTGRD
jgi:hypothetical protein